MRLQYYEDKRRVYTLQIEGSVKQGVIDAVKNESIPMVAQPTAMSMTVGTNRSAQFAAMQSTSPKTALSRVAMGFVQDYGLASPQSTLPPEIALRDPLDQEFVLNRQMAKKYYEKQLQEKMAEKRMKNQADREAWNKQLQDKEAKKEKDIAEQRKGNAQMLKAKVNDRKAAEEERRTQRNQQAKETAMKILKDAKKERKDREDLIAKQTAEYNAKLEEQFKRDKQNRDLAAAKCDEASKKAAANERDISTKLVANEMTI